MSINHIYDLSIEAILNHWSHATQPMTILTQAADLNSCFDQLLLKELIPKDSFLIKNSLLKAIKDKLTIAEFKMGIVTIILYDPQVSSCVVSQFSYRQQISNESKTDFNTIVWNAIALLMPELPPNQTLQIIKSGLTSDFFGSIGSKDTSNNYIWIDKFGSIIDRGQTNNSIATRPQYSKYVCNPRLVSGPQTQPTHSYYPPSLMAAPYYQPCLTV